MTPVATAARLGRSPLRSFGTVCALVLACSAAFAAEPNFPITPKQRSTAQQVAQTGVALSELSPTAPDQYTVKRGDTLWDISKLFLRSPWRWPELWGMNLDQIRNPHLIYPGQLLVLDKSGDRARLRVAQGPGGTVKLSPRVRDAGASSGPIAAVPLKSIESFLNDAVIFENDDLERAPRIVATQEGRVLLGRGDAAYVRGDVSAAREWTVFQQPKPLKDPDTEAVLGYEGVYVATAQYEREGTTNEKGEVVPATFRIAESRLEANVGNRLAPSQAKDYSPYVPRAPGAPVAGRIVSVYGEALNAGQNQIVALNKGARDGLERGHVLALWRAGALERDTTQGGRAQPVRLPDERHGLLFVFRVFDRMAYALILNVNEPVSRGDRFTEP
ncbi:MAG TPA: LysM peptidoglycan-binding domain-containing protein [Methylibium sp.]|uniref:LysM peptidoglycan-binding domain-containing protein n=1 Tax=Methylibium sp. TaxID=2067992 RepID=UPI002DB7FB37|nr:LysM peptidoglycan-binding domain-containing protein [Methylibium sp.]HEU4458721.1 LysM peptidoglycan-binding domain-containing protein [Methylibium sp.]